jgi:hypothetical protein
MPGAIRSAMIGLLALIMGVAACPQPSPASGWKAAVSLPGVCKCCRVEIPKCSTLSCCPISSRAERSPWTASFPSRAAVQWQMVMFLSCQILIIPRSAPDVFSPASVSFLPIRSAPIFQRDCSYLV